MTSKEGRREDTHSPPASPLCDSEPGSVPTRKLNGHHFTVCLPFSVPISNLPPDSEREQREAGPCSQRDDIVHSAAWESTGSSAHGTGVKTGMKSGFKHPLSGLSRENLQSSVDVAVKVMIEREECFGLFIRSTKRGKAEGQN